MWPCDGSVLDLISFFASATSSGLNDERTMTTSAAFVLRFELEGEFGLSIRRSSFSSSRANLFLNPAPPTAASSSSTNLSRSLFLFASIRLQGRLASSPMMSGMRLQPIRQLQFSLFSVLTMVQSCFLHKTQTSCQSQKRRSCLIFFLTLICVTQELMNPPQRT